MTLPWNSARQAVVDHVSTLLPHGERFTFLVEQAVLREQWLDLTLHPVDDRNQQHTMHFEFADYWNTVRKMCGKPNAATVDELIGCTMEAVVENGSHAGSEEQDSPTCWFSTIHFE